MRKYLILLGLAIAPVYAFAQQSQKPQLSPFTRHYLLEASKTKDIASLANYPYKKGADNKVYLSAMVKVSNSGVADEALSVMGVHVGTKAGDIWTLKVPVDKVYEFVNTPGISYIQLDEPAYPTLDQARKTTRVDSVHRGFGLPTPYSGADVVMGVIDFGFDYNHPTFYDTTGSAYRIRKVWELNTAGTPPVGYNYGHEVTDSNDLRTRGTDDAEQTHGTAVAGMAAGSGVGSAPAANRFRGMAYESELVFVGVRRDDIGSQWMQGTFSDFVDGVNYIFTHANSVSKPAVVNISWGSASGPHDGTSLFNQACDNLSGSGKIIVMSAGNEGEEKIHLAKAFTPADTVVSTFLHFTPDHYKRTWVDVWGEPGKTFCASATLYNNGVAGNTTDFICIDDNIHDLYLLGSNGLDTCYVEFITSSSEVINGKPRLTIHVFNKAADSIAISLKATDGSIHAWNEYYYYGYTHRYQCSFASYGEAWAVNGDSISTASDMGSSESVLLVGAYASKSNFTDINGNNWSYNGYVTPGKIVPFSSHGPTADGRVKPDITAPGLTVCTAVSSYDTAYTPTGSNSAMTIKSYVHPLSGKTFYYAEFTGTSASAPATSGIVALMLQVNPALTPQQVKDIIFETAIKDNFTGTLPPQGNNTWGHGKINAYGAVKKVVQQLGVYNFSGKKLDCVLFPNPNNGSFILDYTADKSETVQVNLYSITGSLLRTDVRQAQQGNNRMELNFPGLSAGMYLVKVATREGEVSLTMQVR